MIIIERAFFIKSKTYESKLIANFFENKQKRGIETKDLSKFREKMLIQAKKLYSKDAQIDEIILIYSEK